MLAPEYKTYVNWLLTYPRPAVGCFAGSRPCRCGLCHSRGALQTYQRVVSCGKPGRPSSLTRERPRVGRPLSRESTVFPGDGLPRELDDFLVFLEGLSTGFRCDENPWVEPPAAVLGDTGNVPGVRSYFMDFYREKRVVSRSLKVVLVGREGTGKTRCSLSPNILVRFPACKIYGARKSGLPALLPVCQPDCLPASAKINRRF